MKDGYESDSTLSYRRHQYVPQQSQSKSLYTQVQKGGEVPHKGLRMQAPEKKGIVSVIYILYLSISCTYLYALNDIMHIMFSLWWYFVAQIQCKRLFVIKVIVLLPKISFLPPWDSVSIKEDNFIFLFSHALFPYQLHCTKKS